MTKMTMSGGLLSLDAMIAHAQSDAEFDGLDWETMSDGERDRYLQRVEKGYEAAARVTFAEQVSPHSKN